jgi:hypothetical protein
MTTEMTELQFIRAAIARLTTERKRLDDKIAALELALETWGDEGRPKKKFRPHGLNRNGNAETLEFLRSRGGKPTTLTQMAREGRCSRAAASVRARFLVKAGHVKHVGPGVYAAVVKEGEAP